MNLRTKLFIHLNGILTLLICGAFSGFAQPSVYLKAYPDHIVRTGNNQIVWKDSTIMIFDDGQKKSFAELLQNADLQDQLAQSYPTSDLQNPPAINSDPGRFRYEPFFRKMYGNTQAEVRGHLTEIVWLPKTLRKNLLVTKINNVDKHFEAVSAALEEHPELLKYVNNPAGTFSWRVISGTNRLSMHSYGIAIDINLNLSHYWQWDCRCKDENQALTYRNLIAAKVVEIFEKHGFIWGGKWYHYDTMHFEYRPELLIK